MSNLYFGITMFICIVPTVWILYFYLHPKKWSEKKQILGVNNRKEFLQDGVKEEVEAVTQNARKRALLLVLAITAISAVLVLLHGMFLQTFIWTSFVILAIVIVSVPYLLGHREMMTVKKSLGLTQEKGISFVDLKTAGNIHGLKMSAVLWPNLAGALIMGVLLCADLGVIRIGGYEPGGFMGVTLGGSMFVMGLLITICAYFMDRMKNDVISTDSDVNANYNRAKKKNWADMFVAFLWLNVAYQLITTVALFVSYSNLLITAFLFLYLVLIMVGIVVFVRRGRRIEVRYQKETTVIADDDEYWLGGILYNNPSDHRVIVEKRGGIGGTINIGHPVGKVIGLATIAVMLFSFAMLIYVGIIEATPISLREENGSLICSQLGDVYVITEDMVESMELGDDIFMLQMMRKDGFATDTLLKGNFIVDGKNGCKVFLNPQNELYIHVVTTDGTNYYIAGVSDEETQKVYESSVK